MTFKASTNAKYAFHDVFPEFDDCFQRACVISINKLVTPPSQHLPADYKCSAIQHNKDPDDYDPVDLLKFIAEAPPHSRERKELQFMHLAWTSAKACEPLGSVTRMWMNYDFKWMLHQSRNALAHAPLLAHELGLVQAWAAVLTDGELQGLRHFFQTQARHMEDIKHRICHRLTELKVKALQQWKQNRLSARTATVSTMKDPTHDRIDEYDDWHDVDADDLGSDVGY